MDSADVAMVPVTSGTTSSRRLPDWFKYAAAAVLVVAGIFWLTPQYELIGEEWHQWLEYYEYHRLGTYGAETVYILFAWLLLITAAGGLWFLDHEDPSRRRLAWLSIPAILIAMIFVSAGQSEMETATWTPTDYATTYYTGVYLVETTQHAVVWIALWIGLLAVAAGTIYKHLPATVVAQVATEGSGESSGVQSGKALLDTREQDTSQSSDTSALERRLADLTRLHDHGSITDDEYQSLRQRTLSSFS